MKAAILGGGRGRRMGGANKPLLEFDGRRIVDRQLDVLAPLFDEVLLVVAGGEWDVPRARVVFDKRPGMGPLAGLEAALEEGAELIVAGDLPVLDRDLMVRIRDHAPAEAVIARANGRPQPLCARYSPSVLDKVRARLERGELRVMDFVEELEVAWIDTGPMLNVNTPEDLSRR